MNPIRISTWISLFGLVVTMGCKDLSNPTLPDGVQSPDTYHSPEGGLALNKAATRLLSDVLVDVMIRSGLITDELSNSDRSSSALNMGDARELPENASGTSRVVGLNSEYRKLHKLRGQARLGRSVLKTYAPGISLAVRGQLYAFEAYADVILADLFCSGVPLSTLDFGGDFTYAEPSTTQGVYLQAIALFDSAQAIVEDSATLQTLAAVGKGRALLALGRYEEAAQAVASVPDSAIYQIRVTFLETPISAHKFARYATVSDKEGINGLPFLSNDDPRTISDTIRVNSGGVARLVKFPNKYAPFDSTWFVVASGIEARLIEAEAALHQSSSSEWLSLLNELRTTGTFSRIDTTSTGQIDTVWNAGTGGVTGLGPLQDPGTEASRVDLLFAERAMWLFATGQRQGDLRRLVREYHRQQDSVYPTGIYLNGSSTTGNYGNDFTMPIPSEERTNPYFRGCLSRD